MKNVGRIFKKELLEMMRDKRTFRTALITPFFIVFLMMQMFKLIGGSLSNKETTRVGIVKSTVNSQLVDALKKNPAIASEEFTSLNEAKKLLNKGKVKAVVEFPVEAKEGMTQIPMNVYFVSDETTSSIAVGKLEAWVGAANKAALDKVLASKDIDPKATEVLKLERKDEAKAKGGGNSLLVSILPYLMLLYLYMGGMSIAADLVAGEKERGTLETLLVTPLHRAEIVTGKFLALAIFCVTSSFTVAFALLVGALLDKQVMKMMVPEGMSVGPGIVVGFFLILISLGVLFASVQLCLSILAKNMREASTYLALANMAVIVPAVFNQVIGMTDAAQSFWVRVTPILNSALCLRETLLLKASSVHIAIAVLMSLALAAVFFMLSYRLFCNEKVLTRT